MKFKIEEYFRIFLNEEFERLSIKCPICKFKAFKTESEKKGNSQDFGTLLYEIIQEFLKSCEEINKNENSFLKIFFKHFENLQKNTKCH